MFKECTFCHTRWEDRSAFLSDSMLSLIGYQMNYGDLEAGFFLFNHDVDGCGTSLAVQAGEFTDMHDGPIFEDRLSPDDDECPGYCDSVDSLEACSAKCECSYVRDVLQTVKDWPKKGIAVK